MTRRQFVQGLAMLGVTAASLEAIMGASDPDRRPLFRERTVSSTPMYFVLIVLDAFRPDYMDLAPMPNLQTLRSAGTVYDRAWVGQLESETPVGHASLSTGSTPNHDGVIGFEWRDPRTRGEALDGWPPGVLAGKMEQDLRQSGAQSIPSVIKAANKTDKIVAISSEKVYAADALGGWAADYILHHVKDSTGRTLIPDAVRGHEATHSLYDRPGLQLTLPIQHFTDWDYLSTMLALAALDEIKPKALMVNLPGPDVYGHPYGGPASPLLMKQIVAGLDRNIGRIIDAYKSAGIYEQTLFVVTADHGMVPNVRAVDGSITKAVVRSSGGEYLFHTGGTAADIYLNNYWHAGAVARQMAAVPNVTATYYQRDEHGKYVHLPATGVKIDAALDAAYQYLLGTFSGPTAPDVVAAFRENTIGTRAASLRGDHGGLNWGAQHIPLTFCGPGVRGGFVSSFPARLIDVAPTVLHLLGLSSPLMDGVVLADALLAAEAQDVATQTLIGSSLTAFQDALIAQSTDNIAEDAREKLTPPPALPLKP